MTRSIAFIPDCDRWSPPSPSRSAARVRSDYPAKPITLIVPFTPGGSTSVIARAISDKLSDALKQPIVIDNRGGAGSTIGARAVAKSAPDGYTILLGTNATLTIALSLTPNAGYTRKDLASIGFVGAVPNVVVVNPKVSGPHRSPIWSSLRQGQGRSRSNTARRASAPSIICPASCWRTWRSIKMAHVPYRGAIPALSDLLGGHIPLLFSAIPNVHSHIGAGTVRALAVTSAKRSQLVPDVPHGRRVRLPRLRRRSRLRPAGADRHAASGHRPAQSRAARRARERGRAQAPRPGRRRAARDHAGGVHSHDRSRRTEMVGADQGSSASSPNKNTR